MTDALDVVRNQLHDMARDIIEKPTNKNIITLRDYALRLAEQVTLLKGVLKQTDKRLQGMSQENARLKAEVERLRDTYGLDRYIPDKDAGHD